MTVISGENYPQRVADCNLSALQEEPLIAICLLRAQRWSLPREKERYGKKDGESLFTNSFECDNDRL